MKRNLKKIFTMALCTGGTVLCALLAGCAETPETSLVKQKGEESIKSYEEAPQQESTPEEETTVRELLGAPLTVQSEIKNEPSNVTIHTDAQVEVPDVEKISSVSVTPREFTQELMDRITDAFFSDAVIYTAESYLTSTKEEIEKKLEEMKGYLAEGNLDPYGMGTDENGEYVYDIYMIIEDLEQQYDQAPKTKELVEGRPQAGKSETDVGGTSENDFSGYAVMPDGSEYYYKTASYGAYPMDVTIRKVKDAGKNERGAEFIWHPVSGSDEEKAAKEAQIGISLEEAQKLAEEKIKAMGLTDMSLYGWDISDLDTFDNEGSTRIGSGYTLYYTRTLNGIPITYTMDAGGALENMDSIMESWAYEGLEFIIDGQGIESVHLCNLYEIGETKTENLSLLPFDEIMEIYEKMMSIKNADNYYKNLTYHIDRIVLGYFRIYEPSTDAHTGLLVPVWNFFGTREITYRQEMGNTDGDDAQEWTDTTDYTYWSHLTINAVDGSIIDRSLGY